MRERAFLYTTITFAILFIATVVYHFYTLPAPMQAGPSEIRFGVSLSITGAFSKYGEMHRRAYSLFEEIVNEEGGIYVAEYGKKLPVKIMWYDDHSDASTAAKLYERLITEDKVNFCFGPYSSTITIAITTTTEKYKMP
jgi:branched-chain amino acid transport system substrate-binding protein